jgi:hypothetical protein
MMPVWLAAFDALTTRAFPLAGGSQLQHCNGAVELRDGRKNLTD